MVRIWSLHRGHFLINEVGKLFYKLDQVTKMYSDQVNQDVFWSVNFAVVFCQIYYGQMSTIQLFKILSSLLRCSTHCKKFQEKLRDYVQDVSLWPHFSMGILSVILINGDGDDGDDDMMLKRFLRNSWLRKGVKSYFQPGPLS